MNWAIRKGNSGKHMNSKGSNTSALPDQTPQKAASDQDLQYLYSNILDISRDSRMDYFKFHDKYGR